MKKILVINLGSTSTKIAYLEDEKFVYRESIGHDAEKLKSFHFPVDQYEFRKQSILAFCEEHNIDIGGLDSITSRGGHTEPIQGGTYEINQAMVEEIRSGEFGHHPCGVGCIIAYDLCREYEKPLPLTTDPPVVDEMEPLARYSGLKELPRVANVQSLNIRAMSRHFAESQNKKFEDMRLVTVMLGGGIGVVAIKEGRMIYSHDSIQGDGPFSNNRCCSVSVSGIIKECYSGEYDLNSMLRHINGEGGLVSYLGTTDIRKIMENIEKGDTYAKEVIEAMCYQTAQQIAAMAATLEGKVDAILLIGGMAHVPFIVSEIKKRSEWIAPVSVLAGEREMEALAQGTYEVLTGKREMQHFIPQNEKYRRFIDAV